MFQMPFAEMTVTLEDVGRFLRVPIAGTCIYKESGGWDIEYVDALILVVDRLGVEGDKGIAETDGTSVILIH